MTEYKTIETVTKINIPISTKCDICKKEITGKYWRLTRYHNDWGNDSTDFYKVFDLCSRECINKALDDYINSCKESFTQRFELEQEETE